MTSIPKPSETLVRQLFTNKRLKLAWDRTKGEWITTLKINYDLLVPVLDKDAVESALYFYPNPSRIRAVDALQHEAVNFLTIWMNEEMGV